MSGLLGRARRKDDAWLRNITRATGRAGSTRINDARAPPSPTRRARPSASTRKRWRWPRSGEACAHRSSPTKPSTTSLTTGCASRDFNPVAPNQVWAADITYVRTWQGWLYLAVVIDLFSRRVVGWAIAEHMRTELVLNALTMAFVARQPDAGLIHHSDRGSQYASHAHRQALDDNHAICSMSRKGDCWDNAVVESFFGTLKQELLYRGSWPTKQVATKAIGDYVERFYNTRRRHSSLGYLSQLEYELISARTAQAA
ncbi:MAG: IS3 family transposase [Myxococcales bacterium]|nr:IS3 family transposase [Myxococcales bacterium]